MTDAQDHIGVPTRAYLMFADSMRKRKTVVRYPVSPVSTGVKEERLENKRKRFHGGGG